MKSPEILIWNKTQDRLMTFVLRYTKDRALAEDIVHDVFLKVHDKLPQLKHSEKIAGWIFRIAKNTITDHFRSQSKKIKAADLDWENESVNFNDCVALCLSDMLKALPDKYREALELAQVNDMSQLQLAETLNISYSGAKSRVQRARQMLREKMDKAYRIQFDTYGNAVVCENRLPCGCN